MVDYVKFLHQGRRIAESARFADGNARETLQKAVAHFRSWPGGADFGGMNEVAEIMLRKGFVKDAINVFDETGNDARLEELLGNRKISKEDKETILLILKTRPYAEFTNFKPEPEKKISIPVER
ncbi:MAG: hypothetical protein QXD51_03400 [Candidatus Anstonellales archaeon]